MNVVVMHSYGGPEVLTVEKRDELSPKAGEVVVKVEAAGVNFADTMRRYGKYLEPTPLPFVLGAEVAGTVIKVGEGVGALTVGDRVFGAIGMGGYAGEIALPAGRFIKMPPGLTFEQAAALPIQGLSAALLLKDAGNLVAGETVLIEGAAGGVGLIAVQLAKYFGAKAVYGLASTAEKRKLVEDFGADKAFDPADPNWPAQLLELTGNKGADLALSSSGGETRNRGISALSPFGRIIVYGDASNSNELAVDPHRVVTRNLTVSGFSIAGYFAKPGVIPERMGELIKLVLTGKLKLHIGATLPLSEAAEAHRLLENRKTVGKVILRP